MNFIQHHYILILILMVLIFLFLAATSVLEAYLDTHKRPREEMYLCHIHGPMRMKHCLPLFPGMTMKNGKPFVICPMCYKEGVFDEVNKKANLYG